MAETWVFNPAADTWQLAATTGNPGPRAGHGMVYDSLRQRVVLFGGYSVYGGPLSNEVWLYDAATAAWTNPQPTVKPPPVAYPGMAYDPVRAKVVLYAGPADTWAYDAGANTWANLGATGGPPLTNATGSACYECLSLSFDAVSDKLYAFALGADYWGHLWELPLGAVPPPPSITILLTDVWRGADSETATWFTVNRSGIAENWKLVLDSALGLSSDAMLDSYIQSTLAPWIRNGTAQPVGTHRVLDADGLEGRQY